MNNELAHWLSIYDRNMPRGGSNNYAAGASPWGTLVGRDDDANHAGGRLLWAMAQAQDGQRRERPNFFANLAGDNFQPAAYREPQPFNEMQPRMSMRSDPMRQPANNYLMKLLGGR